MTLKKLFVAAFSISVIFSGYADAQSQVPENNQTNPAVTVIQKLSLMGKAEFGKFPLTEEEINQAAEFLIDQSAKNGQTLSRDQALLALGFISGQLSVFAELRSQNPTEPTLPETLKPEQQTSPTQP